MSKLETNRDIMGFRHALMKLSGHFEPKLASDLEAPGVVSHMVQGYPVAKANLEDLDKIDQAAVSALTLMLAELKKRLTERAQTQIITTPCVDLK